MTSVTPTRRVQSPGGETILIVEDLIAIVAQSKDKLAKLTPREREVLVLVGKGLHAKEIARALAISPRTVEVHKASLMAKLGARNVAELVRYALTADKHS